VLIHPGTQTQLVKLSAPAAGTTARDFSIQSDAVLLSLSASAVSGNLSVVVYPVASDGTTSSPALVSFPVLSAPTSGIVTVQSGVIPSALRLVATYSGPCSFEVVAKAVSSPVGEVEIVGTVDVELVENLRQQILKAADRVTSYTYADVASNKNRRITRIDYTASSIGSYTARRNINYTLVGTEYVRTTDTWEIL
jgi:hypothetical protein